MSIVDEVKLNISIGKRVWALHTCYNWLVFRAPFINPMNSNRGRKTGRRPAHAAVVGQTIKFMAAHETRPMPQPGHTVAACPVLLLLTSWGHIWRHDPWSHGWMQDVHGAPHRIGRGTLKPRRCLVDRLTPPGR
jgi:hypothetical protein